MDSDRPFVAFKYRTINKFLISEIVESSLHFSSAERLNDPFDSRVRATDVVRSLLTQDVSDELRTALLGIDKDPNFYSNFENGYRDFGICSFSIDLENVLLWSHYANEHRGLALTYEFPLEFLDQPSEIYGVSPVTYEENAVSDWLRMNASLFNEDHFEFVTELLKKILTSKAPAWSYEQEGRIIRPSHGPFAIPRKLLKSVTFGLRTSTSDKNLVRKIVDKYYVGVSYNRIVKTDDDFGIRAVSECDA